jgi:hypothetical protein
LPGFIGLVPPPTLDKSEKYLLIPSKFIEKTLFSQVLKHFQGFKIESYYKAVYTWLGIMNLQSIEVKQMDEDPSYFIEKNNNKGRHFATSFIRFAA